MGDLEGWAVMGAPDGLGVGRPSTSSILRLSKAALVGRAVGGVDVGDLDGTSVGDLVGEAVGDIVGAPVGSLDVGALDGAVVALAVVGLGLVGLRLGLAVGVNVGAKVGLTVLGIAMGGSGTSFMLRTEFASLV